MKEHSDHTHGIECTDCEEEFDESSSSRPWFKEARVILLVISALVAIFAFLLELTGVPLVVVRVIYAIAILAGGYYPAKLGVKALRDFTLNINTLLVTATVGAAVLGLWEEAAVLVFVFSLGSVLETYAVDRARNAVGKLIDLTPRHALVTRNGKEILVDVDEILMDETILIRPGEKIPLDGAVTGGSSSVDQSPITGESVPVFKSKGDQVYAGAINQRGTLEVRVTHLSTDTTLAKIIHSIEEHQSRKSTYQRFGERFGRLYTPIIFVIALAVAVLPPVFFNGSWTEWLYRALVVLVVSCSCGIALSVPVAVVSAIANAARHGVLFKGGAYLELGSKIKVLVFDKTGTLTTGKPEVTDIVALKRYTETAVLGIAASIEARSEHPLAESILKKARRDKLHVKKSSDFHIVPGMGARATIDGIPYHVGSERLFAAHSISTEPLKDAITRLEEDGKTIVFVGGQNTLIGLIAVADKIRPEAVDVVVRLKHMGISVAMLTGDNTATAAAIAKTTDIPEYRALLLPEDKVHEIEQMSEAHGRIAMVGDGINDAPAMAAASIGIAMGAAGTDIAIETADIALMSDDLSKLPYIFHLCRRTMNNMTFNITAALCIVAVLVPAALLGKIDLVPGLLINEFGALLIILNGLRLLR